MSLTEESTGGKKTPGVLFGPQELQQMAAEIFDERFTEYAEYREAILERAMANEQTIREQLEVQVAISEANVTPLPAVSGFSRVAERVYRAIAGIPVPIKGIIIGAGVGLFGHWIYDYFIAGKVGFLSNRTLVSLAGIIYVPIIFTSIFTERDAARTQQFDDELEKSLQRRQARAAVLEAINRAVGEEAKKRDLATVPASAPRLVELDTSTIIPSATLKYLTNFVVEHDSSAIGLAGSRGSGKSTLLRALASDDRVTDRTITLSAPTYYDAVDFTRYLYFRIASQVDGANGSSAFRAARRSRMMTSIQRVVVGVLVAAFGLGLFMVKDSGGILDKLLSSPWQIIGLGFGLLGTGIFILGYGQMLLVFMPTARRRGEYALGNAPSSVLAAEALEDLRFDAEHGMKSKNSFSLFGKTVSFDDESSKTLKTRALTHPELTSGLRKLLQTYAEEDNANPLVVAIDELDKLNSTEDLIRMVNGLKDLFHIDGVHFLVSVSSDALRSFFQRGMPTRDAFDSSFDTIIPVGSLTMNESVTLLENRAPGFPEELSKFCHAWSGGLPRDLLRAARRCVEVQRKSETLMSLQPIIEVVVIEDLHSAFSAQLQTANIPEVGTYLMEVIAYISDTEKRIPSLPLDAGPSLEVMTKTVELGVALIEYFGQRLQNPLLAAPAILNRVVEAAALAMAGRGENLMIASIRFEQATKLIHRLCAASPETLQTFHNA